MAIVPVLSLYSYSSFSKWKLDFCLLFSAKRIVPCVATPRIAADHSLNTRSIDDQQMESGLQGATMGVQCRYWVLQLRVPSMLVS